MPMPGLVPLEPGSTPNYWCTWGIQGYACLLDHTVNAFGLEGHLRNVEVLTEANLFGPAGWVTSDYFAPIKADLYVVYDVGWDVPLTQNSNGEFWKLWLGSMIVAEDKFPSCTGTPAQRLQSLNELTKAAGWRGAGLWLHAEHARKALDQEQPSQEQLEAYFRERAGWCRTAGIKYWKVDYGKYCADLDFRAMLTRVANEEYPELLVEHARNGGPFNDQPCPYDSAKVNHTGTFRAWGDGSVLDASLHTLRFSKVFRAYDLSYKLSNPTMLDRTAQLLADVSEQPQVTGIINVEDEAYLGAALGCSIGIMHHEFERPEKRGNAIRAVRWQRIAPAFGAGLSANRLDDQRLEDSWRFHSGDDWVDWMEGQVVIQSAPARVTRDLPLPEVRCEGPQPYVLATRFPSGAVAIATRARVTSAKSAFFPLADVTLDLPDESAPIGIFGRYRSLTLRFPASLTGKRVLAQDLAADTSLNISDQVTIQGSDLTLAGGLIERIGRSVLTGPQDESEPGLVLLLSSE